jgi:hypothetical protein
MTSLKAGDWLKTTVLWYADANVGARKPVHVDDFLLVVSIADIVRPPTVIKHDHIIMTLLHPVYGPIDWRIQWTVWSHFLKIVSQ